MNRPNDDPEDAIGPHAMDELEVPRQRIRRRYADEQPEPIYPFDEDAIPPRRVRWWHIAGALFLIGILLLETLAPVIQGILDIIRFVPSSLGEPL